MSLKLNGSLLAFVSLAALVSLAPIARAEESGSKPSVSSDVHRDKAIDLKLPSFDYGTIQVQPSVLEAKVGGGTQASPQGEGNAFTFQINASTRYPLSINRDRAFGGDHDSVGWDVELAPGVSMRLDLSKLSPEEKTAITKGEVSVSGLTLLRGFVCGKPGRTENCNGDSVASTADISIGRIGGRWAVNTLLKKEEKGVDVQAIGGSVHHAEKIGPVQIDLCASAQAGGLVGVGKGTGFSVGDRQAPGVLYLEAGACAGVKLGERGGVINDQFRFRRTFDTKDNASERPQILTLSNTISYDRFISPKNPVGVFWTAEREQVTGGSTSGAAVDSHFFGVQGKF
jgi:hypothetical protein